MTEEQFLIRLVIPTLLCLLSASIIMLAGCGHDDIRYEIAAFFIANGGVALIFATNMGVTIWHRHHNQWLRNGS